MANHYDRRQPTGGAEAEDEASEERVEGEREEEYERAHDAHGDQTTSDDYRHVRVRMLLMAVRREAAVAMLAVV